MIKFIWSKSCGELYVDRIPAIFMSEYGKVKQITELSDKGWCRVVFENNLIVDINDVSLIARPIEIE